MSKQVKTYEPPRLVFADDDALDHYVQQYPEIVKLANDEASQKVPPLAIVALTAVDVATLYLDAKYYNG